MYGSNALYTPQLQASLQLQWLAVIMVRYPGEWWRPCMGIHISGKWFATSSDCFLGMDSSGAIRNSNVVSARVASGFYTLNTTNNHVFNTNLEFDAQAAFLIEEYKDNGGPNNYLLNGRVLMIKVAKYPYGIANAPLSDRKIDFRELNKEDCYSISYDDAVDTKIFPQFQPTLRLQKLLQGVDYDCTWRMPPKYGSQDKFDYCYRFINERKICIHDVGAPLVCNNVVRGIIYRVENPDCPTNGRGWRQDKDGKETYEKEFPQLSHKQYTSSSRTMNGYLDISLYKGEFEKLMKYEGVYKEAEDAFLLGKRMDWSDAPISAEMTLPTRPFPDWKRSTLVFQEWPITMEITTLPDDYYYEDNANETDDNQQIIDKFNVEDANDEDHYTEDHDMEDMKCQYSHSDNIHHALGILTILLISFLIF